MDAAVLPINRTHDQTMFDGVVMNIVYVMAKIRFGTYTMFPKSALSYRLLTFALAAAKHCGAYYGFNFLDECTLDVSPSDGIIGIIGWQCPYCVDVIKQNNHCINLKGSPYLHGTNRFA